MERKINRREFIKVMFAGGAAGTAVMALPRLAFPMTKPGNTSKTVAKRPNIVLIMADDMGYSDIGCYGGEIHTPNLNSLAAKGLRFTQFYNTARCCPTRAALMTGLYQHQAGIGFMVWSDRGFDGYRGDLSNRCVTIAEALKRGGYATYMSGKWHVTKHVGHWSGDDKRTSKHNWPCQRGFDRFYGTITGAGSFYNPLTLTNTNKPVESVGQDFYYTDAISDHAVSFISEHAKAKPNEQPFFCYVAYTAPHWPLHAPQQDIAKYKGRYDKGWDALRDERHKRMIKMGIIDAKWKLTPRDEGVPPWENAKNKKWQARRMEVYAAQVDKMDQGIGRIVKALQNTGKLENTLIFFLSDNGGCAEELTAGWSKLLDVASKTRDGRNVMVGNNPQVMPGPETTFQSYGLPWANASDTPFRRYKHWVHEGGIATPLIVHWPAAIKQTNELRHQPGHVIDIMATCLDVAGIDYPKTYKGYDIIPLEGKTLVPIFQDPNSKVHEAIYWEHEGNRAVRAGKWKLVALYDQPWELYDLQADRTELNNLAHKYPQKVEQLKAMYQSWAKRSGVQPWSLIKPEQDLDEL